jgi:hypothetical protein
MIDEPTAKAVWRYLKDKASLLGRFYVPSDSNNLVLLIIVSVNQWLRTILMPTKEKTDVRKRLSREPECLPVSILVKDYIFDIITCHISSDTTLLCKSAAATNLYDL